MPTLNGGMRGGMEIGGQGTESSEVKGECAMRDVGRTERPTGMMAWPPSRPQVLRRDPLSEKRGGGVTAEIGERRGALETSNFDD